MTQDELYTIILREAFYVHTRIGPGMLERVYKTCLAHRLRLLGLKVEVEKAVPVIFDDIKMDCGYQADIVVEDMIVIEIKNVDALADIHVAQTLTYLRFLKIRRGLLLNFKTTQLKNGIKRVINGY
jgi:GxxExxY protein